MFDRWLAKLLKELVPSLLQVVVIVGITILVMLLIPARYEAGTTLYFPTDPQSTTTAASALSALGGGGVDPVDIAEGIVNSRRVVRAISLAAKVDLLTAQYSIGVDKHPTQSIVGIRVQMGKPKQALAGCQALVREFFSIRDDVDEETQRIVTRQLIAEIAKTTEQLANEHIKYGTLMQDKKAIPFDSADTMIATGMATVRQLQLDLDDAEKTYRLVQQNQNAAIQSAVELPSTSATSIKYHDLVNKARLQLQTDEVTYGPASTIVQRDIGQLKEVERQANEEARKEKAAVARNVAPSNSAIGSLGDLDVRRRELRRKLQAAVEQVKQMVESMPTTQRESLKVKVLENSLAALSGKLEEVKADAAIQTPPWFVLDPPELAPTPINRSFSKASLLGVLLGVIFVFARLWVIVRKEGPQSAAISA
jgi:hypothetical protein